MTKVISIMVKICIDCGAPLIYTFAFRGKEYWCPSCGYTSGIFGAGVDVPVTEELKEKLRMSKKKSKVFLHAHGILKGGACATDYKGKQTEIKDLPLEYMDQLRKDLEGWEYEM